MLMSIVCLFFSKEKVRNLKTTEKGRGVPVDGESVPTKSLLECSDMEMRKCSPNF